MMLRWEPLLNVATGEYTAEVAPRGTPLVGPKPPVLLFAVATMPPICGAERFCSQSTVSEVALARDPAGSTAASVWVPGVFHGRLTAAVARTMSASRVFFTTSFGA